MWLEKQDASTISDFMSRAKATLQAKQQVELPRLKAEFNAICENHGVTLSQVFMYGRPKPGRKAKSNTARIIEDDNSSS